MITLYRIDIDNKKLIELPSTQFSTHNLKERYDIQEWIEKTPEILREKLLIIYKELELLPSRTRLDLLAVDKEANLVIIELKRDDSGTDTEWQAIKYTSYCSNFLPEEIFEKYAKYLQSDEDDARLKIEEFIEKELEKLNEKQRIILVSRKFHSDVISAVLWLRDYEIDIECVRLNLYTDRDNQLFITPDLIIPLPEAKDYIQKKEIKQKEAKRSSVRSSFSLEKGDFPDDELKRKLIATLRRETDLTLRLISFLEIISSEERIFNREEVKSKLYDKGIGINIGQSGSYLSNISQFLTKKSNPHLRQIIEFRTGGSHGETKNDYKVLSHYQELLKSVLEEVKADVEDKSTINEENS